MFGVVYVHHWGYQVCFFVHQAYLPVFICHGSLCSLSLGLQRVCVLSMQVYLQVVHTPLVLSRVVSIFELHTIPPLPHRWKYQGRFLFPVRHCFPHFQFCFNIFGWMCFHAYKPLIKTQDNTSIIAWAICSFKQLYTWFWYIFCLVWQNVSAANNNRNPVSLMNIYTHTHNFF